MKARREMFSISDMASLERGEITLEDFDCQSLAAQSGAILAAPRLSRLSLPGRAFICEALLWPF